MRTRTAQWFETTVRYFAIVEGEQKTVTELYTVDAVSFAEAEARITEFVQPMVVKGGSLSIKRINPAPYAVIIFTSDNERAVDTNALRYEKAFLESDRQALNAPFDFNADDSRWCQVPR